MGRIDADKRGRLLDRVTGGSEMIEFKCPSCQRKLGGPDEAAGRTVTCPKCGKSFELIVDLEAAPTPSPESTRGHVAKDAEDTDDKEIRWTWRGPVRISKHEENSKGERDMDVLDRISKRLGIKKGCVGCLIAGVIVLAFLFVPAMIKDARNRRAGLYDKPAQSTDERGEAWVAAKTFVTGSLKSPSTADFGSVWKGTVQNPETCVTNMGENRYRVRGWVDSQNSFGATVRTDFEVEVELRGGGWYLVSDPIFQQR